MKQGYEIVRKYYVEWLCSIMYYIGYIMCVYIYICMLHNMYYVILCRVIRVE